MPIACRIWTHMKSCRATLLMALSVCLIESAVSANDVGQSPPLAVEVPRRRPPLRPMLTGQEFGDQTGTGSPTRWEFQNRGPPKVRRSSGLGNSDRDIRPSSPGRIVSRLSIKVFAGSTSYAWTQTPAARSGNTDTTGRTIPQEFIPGLERLQCTRMGSCTLRAPRV